MADYDNGINGETGKYLFPASTDREIATHARETCAQVSITDLHTGELQERANLRDQPKAPAAWVDPTDLAKAGWGVIFAPEYPHYTLEKLKSNDGLGLLLEHRQRQATQVHENYFKILKFEPEWNKTKFLRKHKAPISGPVDPELGVPYYLLIVGDPATIPYEFQYQLDVQYAVGRIYFETLNEYAQYAKSIVLAETKQMERSQKIQFWGVSNSGDNSTQLSAKHLVTPLSNWVANKHPNWATPTLIGKNDKTPNLSACKANLDRLLNQGPAPAILFTASHGVGYPKNHPLQRDFQGALVTQDWAKFLGKPDPENHLFSAADIQANADFHGMIAFHFACYGLGTPQFNDFKYKDGEPELADRPFVARLPQKLLTHGALAVIGHIDRAWTHSFRNKSVNQSNVFQSMLTCLMQGCPVGYAMEFFNQEYAEFASDCNLAIQTQTQSHKKIATLWTQSNNARNFAIFGDPAVKITGGGLLERGTAEEEPLVWFSGKSAQSPRVQPPDSDDSKKTVTERLAQLEKQVQVLQKESASLRQEIEELKRQNNRT